MTKRSTELSPDAAIDERWHDLLDLERSFYRQETGIQDDDEIKAHFSRVQVEASQIFPLHFAKRLFPPRPMMCQLSPYQDLLRIGKSRKGAIFLDIGSSVGNDARKLVADGYPLEQVVTTDIRQEFVDIGHKLFKTTQETYPIAFIPGDVFDPKHLDTFPPLASVYKGPMPDLCTLTSLNLLRGRVSAIHASSFFHLFSEEQQLHVARALAGLLSPEPGSMIFGMHGSNYEKGFVAVPGEPSVFCHSPDSWGELWDGVIFEEGVVDVYSQLMQVGGPDDTQDATLTVLWSVKRL